MKKLFWIPIWFHTLLVIPFLKEPHVWIKKPPTLESWEDNGTPLAWEINIIFWVMWFLVIVLILKYFQ